MRYVLVAALVGCSFLAGCGGEYDPTVVVDNTQVKDMKKYNSDLAQCKGLAKTIDLNSEVAVKALAGACCWGSGCGGCSDRSCGRSISAGCSFYRCWFCPWWRCLGSKYKRKRS